MNRFIIQETIERIEQMEFYFDELQRAANTNPAVILEDSSLKDLLRILIRYYEGGQWLKDYECDERGELPVDLKRGVLSQDGIYNLLFEIDRTGGGSHGK